MTNYDGNIGREIQFVATTNMINKPLLEKNECFEKEIDVIYGAL